MEQRLKTRPQSPALAADLNAVGVGDALRFFGLRITDSQGLARFAGVGALNTDDRPRVLFDAPVFSYRRQAPEWEALMELIAANPEPDTGEYQGVIGSDAEFAGRLNRYVKSRNAYLHGLVASRLGNEAEAVQGFIRSVEASPDFTAGYAQCLRRAGLLAHRSPEEAKALLRRLVQAQPANPVAAEMLRRLESR